MKIFRLNLLMFVWLSSLIGQASKMPVAYFSSDYDNLYSKNNRNTFIGDKYSLDGETKFTVEAWVFHSSTYWKTNAQGGDGNASADYQQNPNKYEGRPFKNEGKLTSYHHNHHWISYGRDKWNHGFKIGFAQHGTHAGKFEYVPSSHSDEYSIVDEEPILNNIWDEWVHMAVTFDNAQVKLYLNGELIKDGRLGNNHATALNQGGNKDGFMIGNTWRWGANNSFNGFLKLVRVWKGVALSEETINTFKGTYVDKYSAFHPEIKKDEKSLLINMPLDWDLGEENQNKYWYSGWGHKPTMNIVKADWWKTRTNSNILKTHSGYNLKATGGHNPYILDDVTEEKIGYTEVTWEWPTKSEYVPSKFYIYRAEKKEQNNPINNEMTGGWKLAYTTPNGYRRSFWDTNVPNDKTYFYKIVSHVGNNALGEGSYMVTGKAHLAAGPPTNLTATRDNENMIDLNWDEVEENSPSHYFINQSNGGDKNVKTGKNRYLRLPKQSSVDDIKKRSIDFWYKPDNKSDYHYLVKGDFHLLVEPQNGFFTVKNDVDPNYTTIEEIERGGLAGNKRKISVPVNKWSHFAITDDGTDQKFYLNGELMHTLKSSLHKRRDLTFGKINSYFAYGSFDNIRIWNEVKDFSKGGTSNKDKNIHLGNEQYASHLTAPKDLVAYYKFDGNVAGHDLDDISFKSSNIEFVGEYERARSANGPWYTKLENKGSSNSTTVNNIISSSNRFTIKSFNIAGTSNESNEAIGIQIGEPKAPEHVAVKSVDGDFVIDWSYKSSNPESFKIIRDGNELTDVISGNLRNYKISNPEGEACTALSLSVKAVNTIGENTSKNYSLKFSGEGETGKSQGFVQLHKEAFYAKDKVSITFWSKFTGDTFKDMYLLDGRDVKNKATTMIKINGSGRLYWYAGYNSRYDQISTTLKLETIKDKWVHWTFIKDVKDNGKMSIYMNGELLKSATNKKRSINESVRVVLGATLYRNIGSKQFQGFIDELIIANKAFSPSQIKEIYKNANNTFSYDKLNSSIDAHYTFDSKDNLVLNDLTTKNRDGKILNSASVVYEEVSNKYLDSVALPSTVIKKPSLARDIGDDPLLVSKGYYNNKIEVSWPKLVMGNVDRLEIYRKEIGVNGKGSLVKTITSKVLLSWDDETMKLGTLYEYSATGFLDCYGEELKYNISPDNGYAEPSGIVSGQIQYKGTSVNVPNVEVSLNPKNENQLGSAIQLNLKSTDDYIKTSFLDISPSKIKDLSIEVWIRPEKIEQSNKQFLLGQGESGGAQRHIYISNKKLEIGMGRLGYWSPDKELIDSQWHHIAIIYDNSNKEVRALINGETFVKTYEDNPLIQDPGENYEFRLGMLGTDSSQKYSGQVDELKIWSKALASEILKDNWNSYSNGTEENLILYHRYNLDKSETVYDRSRVVAGGTATWNKNDGKIMGTISYSKESLPSLNNLYHRAITNDQGKYVIKGIYYTDPSEQGQTFTITPKRRQDKFNGRTTVNLGLSTPLMANVNYANESSTIVTGNIKFTSKILYRIAASVEDIPSRNVEILLDGKSTNPITTTDALGNYRLVVPLGRHVIKPSLPLHTFDYEPTPGVNAFYDFLSSKDNDGDGIIDTVGYNYDYEDVQGINFIDNTLLKVIGRVNGGWQELEKFPGKTTNNIGLSKLRFISEDGKLEVHVETDPKTGFFKLDLPPKRYNVLTTVLSNQTLLTDPGAGNLSFDLAVPNSRQIVNGDVMWEGSIGDSIIYQNNNIEASIDNSIVATEQSFTISDVSKIEPGDYIKIDDEILLVNSINNKEISVLRGQDGTIAVGHESNKQIFKLDRVKFNKMFDVIYYAKPMVEVTQANGGSLPTSQDYKVSDGSKVMTRSFFSKNSPLEGLEWNKTKWPIFEQDKSYQVKIKAFQKYENRDGVGSSDPTPNDKIDNVPLKKARISMTNQIAHYSTDPQVGGGVYIIEMSNDEYTKDSETHRYSLGDTVYSFIAGYPNVLRDTLLTDYSYTRTWAMVLQEKNSKDQLVGKAVDWYPNDQYDVNLVSSRTPFRGVVTGLKTIADGFETQGPDEVFLVLRDPPGSQSFSSFITNTEFCRNESWTIGTNRDTRAGGLVGSTTKVNTGAGGGLAGPSFSQELVKIDQTATLSVGFSSGFQSSTAEKICYSCRESVSTSKNDVGTISAPELNVGAMADVFMGYSRNFGIGQARSLQIDMSEGNEGNVVLSNTVAVQTNSIATNFIYTENHIRTKIIPNYKSLRNIYLSNSENHTLNFGTAEDSTNFCSNNDCTEFDKRYGTNNDDPIWGEDATSKSIAFVEDEDFDGLSYTFDNTQQENIDSVRWYNQNIRSWNDILIDNAKAKIDAKLSRNIAFNAGPTYEYSEINSSSKSSSKDLEFQVSSLQEQELVAKVVGAKSGFKRAFTMGLTNNKKFSKSEDLSVEVSYVLEDDDNEDYFSVNIREDPIYRTPVFETVSGASQNPWERGVYHTDGDKKLVNVNSPIKPFVYPYLEGLKTLSSPTLQIQKPTISISEADKYNVPNGERAIYEVIIGNESEINVQKSYLLRVEQNTNPYGATVRFNGDAFSVNGTSFLLDPGQQKRGVIEVSQPPVSYNLGDSGIQLTLTDELGLDENIKVATNIRASWDPVCSPVNVFTPKNNWVANRFNNVLRDGNPTDTLAVVINGYEIEQKVLEFVQLQYKSSNGQQWSNLEKFWKKPEIGDIDPNKKYIPSEQDYIQYEWNLTGLGDKDYILRAFTNCGGTNIVYSEENEGTIDRMPPHLFGFPYAGDVVTLKHDDDLAFQFNEPIDGGRLAPGNFDIRSEINYSKISHEASLSFMGSVNDYLDIKPFLSGASRSLTIEFWLKRSQENVEEVILSHGSQVANSGLEFGFRSDNKAFISTYGDSLVSMDAFNFAHGGDTGADWHHYAIVIDASSLPVKLWLYRDGNTVIVNDGSSNTSKYLSNIYKGTGGLTIGKGLGNSKPFKGNIHDFRIWEKFKTTNEVYSNFYTYLKGSEKGLIGYWRMDDAYGNLAEDRARDHHATINGASWEVNRYSSGYGGGQAITLSDSGHIKIPDSLELALTNLTLEAWIRFESAANRTVFMKGAYGYGLSIDSSNKLRYWSKDITAMSDAAVSDLAVKTGEWNHVAVTSDGSNVKFYINGLFAGADRTKASVVSANGPLYIGKSGLKGTDYFNGQIDEARVWSSVRSFNQIKLDMTHALNGDESGLVWYLPFERWNEATRTIIGDRTDHTIKGNQITDHASREFGPLGDTTLVKETPAPFLFYAGNSLIELGSDLTTSSKFADFTLEASDIKSPRPYERHTFKFSWNQGQIKLWPDRVDHTLEGQLVDVSIKNIFDFNGNLMSSPLSIHAYYDRNPVQWYTSEIELVDYTSNYLGQTFGSSTVHFEALIGNRGGRNETFNITGLPDWLSVSPVTGTINANSTTSNNRAKNILFTANQNLNTGTYNQIINLESSFGTSHQLPIQLRILREPPLWENPVNKSHMMPITGRLKVNGIPSDDPYDRIAAYVGTELRGWAQIEYVQKLDEYLFYLPVYSNQASGETVKLKVWNASNGRLHPSVSPTFTFSSTGSEGTPLSPKEFDATTDVVQWISISAGANWNSLNVTASDMKVNTLFGSSLSTLDSIVTSSATNTKTSGSFSSSLSLNNIAMSKIYANKAYTYEIEGAPITPSGTSISLSQGWNWIGYTPNFNLEVNEAMANFFASDGDIISSYEEFSTFDSETGWLGSLETMIPGKGYMLYTSQSSPQALVYPDAGIFLRTPALKSLSDDYVDIGWDLEEKYNYSMYMVATINMNEVRMSFDDQLAAFNGDKIVGHSTPIAVKDTLLYFIPIHSNQKIDKENISLKVFSKRDGNIKAIVQRFSFEDGAILGSIDRPISLLRSSLSRDDFGYIPNEFVLDQNYPNPFNPSTKIGFGIPQAGNIRVVIYNLLGQEVIRLWDGQLEPGYRFVSWDGSDQFGSKVSAGIYLVMMEAPGFRKTRKMLLIK